MLASLIIQACGLLQTRQQMSMHRKFALPLGATATPNQARRRMSLQQPHDKSCMGAPSHAVAMARRRAACAGRPRRRLAPRSRPAPGAQAALLLLPPPPRQGRLAGTVSAACTAPGRRQRPRAPLHRDLHAQHQAHALPATPLTCCGVPDCTIQLNHVLGLLSPDTVSWASYLLQSCPFAGRVRQLIASTVT